MISTRHTKFHNIKNFKDGWFTVINYEYFQFFSITISLLDDCVNFKLHVTLLRRAIYL